jgi:hypothetical protein
MSSPLSPPPFFPSASSSALPSTSAPRPLRPAARPLFGTTPGPAGPQHCAAHHTTAATAAAAACPGISLKALELYLLVFVTRNLDLVTHLCPCECRGAFAAAGPGGPARM